MLPSVVTEEEDFPVDDEEEEEFLLGEGLLDDDGVIVGMNDIFGAVGVPEDDVDEVDVVVE